MNEYPAKHTQASTGDTAVKRAALPAERSGGHLVFDLPAKSVVVVALGD